MKCKTICKKNVSLQSIIQIKIKIKKAIYYYFILFLNVFYCWITYTFLVMY
jgi:hypothetical protein